jgi:hypothetical protein
MTQFYTNIKNTVRAAGLGGGLAVDSRSAPVSR